MRLFAELRHYERLAAQIIDGVIAAGLDRARLT